ncbi:MAG: tripartite tricarboxylate transporter TctB family protein [Sulfitobacter sp. SK025]|nr:MAG: tripartite tricarboxylate transporter TctB family protein [Sulfitobacter sp. SK025]
MMLVFGGMLLFQALRDIKSIKGLVDLMPKDKNYNMVKPTLGILLIGVYFGLLKWFGFFWCTPPLFAALMWINGERRPKVLIPLALIVPVFLFLLFEYVFLLPLPRGSVVEWP